MMAEEEGILEMMFGGIIMLMDAIIKYGIGLLIVAILGLMFYLWFMKPNPTDMGKEVFEKYWDATAERLRLKTPKKLALCTYPASMEELRENIHQLKYDHIGNIIGFNVAGVITDDKTLYDLSENADSETFERIKEENKEAIKENRFWFIFACEKKTTQWLLPKTQRRLIWVKAAQIINLNSSDNVIRVRGLGLTPQGYCNELINDEQVNVNRKQLMLDNIAIMNEEVLLKAYSGMADIVQECIKSDSRYKKEVALEGVKAIVPSKPEEDKSDT